MRRPFQRRAAQVFTQHQASSLGCTFRLLRTKPLCTACTKASAHAQPRAGASGGLPCVLPSPAHGTTLQGWRRALCAAAGRDTAPGDAVPSAGRVVRLRRDAHRGGGQARAGAVRCGALRSCGRQLVRGGHEEAARRGNAAAATPQRGDAGRRLRRAGGGDARAGLAAPRRRAAAVGGRHRAAGGALPAPCQRRVSGA